VVSDDVVTGNREGIRLSVTSSGNRFASNDFTGNPGAPARCDGADATTFAANCADPDGGIPG
jgi:parallel beta-helix repeat protein